MVIYSKKAIKMFLWVFILLGVSSMFWQITMLLLRELRQSETTNQTEEDKYKDMTEVNEVFTYISNADMHFYGRFIYCLNCFR